MLKLLGNPLPCAYVKRQHKTDLNVGYLVMEYIEPAQGKLLSTYWTDKSHEKKRRIVFLRDLSNVMLSLAQHPFPKMGSLIITDDGFLRLCNRPLTFRLQQLENKGIPTGIDRGNTYFSTDSYLADLLSCQDSRIRHQANSICNEADGKKQLSVLAAMRAIMPHFVKADHRYGPFIFTLTDIHPNNVFVDENWRIKCIIDLEWACIKPMDMMLPPVWLTGRKVDELPKGDLLDNYKKMLDEFFDCFEIEEKLYFSTGSKILGIHTIKESWNSGRFWYFHALDNPKVIQNLFFQHIKPKLEGSETYIEQTEFIEVLYRLWGHDASNVIDSKTRELEAYRARIRHKFE